MSERHPLISHLEALRDNEDRAALAALRRSLAGQPFAAYPLIARFFPARFDPPLERALLVTASLFALHPASANRSLAGALRLVGDATASQSVEQRFVSLLESEAEDLPEHLRHAVSLVRAHDVGIDWDDLMQTVRWWGDAEKTRQRRWARDYWAPLAQDEEGA